MNAISLAPIVLIVDDEVDARLAVMDVLLEAGYQPVTAKDGLEALELLRSGLNPIAMLVDLSMPLMDGAALCAECDSRPELKSIRRVIVSGHDVKGSGLDTWGAHAFVPKPIVAEDLLKAITSPSREPAL